MGGYLEIKLVKPTKVFSRTPDQASVEEFQSAQAHADMGTAGAGVLRETYATVRQELGGLDLTNAAAKAGLAAGRTARHSQTPHSVPASVAWSDH
jgi:hypothetical protein